MTGKDVDASVIQQHHSNNSTQGEISRSTWKQASWVWNMRGRKHLLIMAPLENTSQCMIHTHCSGFEPDLCIYPFYEPCLFMSLYQSIERQWRANSILYFLLFIQGLMWISKREEWVLYLLFIWAMIPWTLSTCITMHPSTALNFFSLQESLGGSW